MSLTTTTPPPVAGTLAADPAQPIGVMFSGGGARGAFQVGVWEVLASDPRAMRDNPPEVLSGTSAGAINAALIAAGLSPQRMLEFWISVSDDPPVHANARVFADLRQGFERLAREAQPLKRRAREGLRLTSLLRKHRWYQRSGLAAAVTEFALTARFDRLSALLSTVGDAYLFDTAGLRDRLRDFIGADHIPDRGVKLAINTVEVESGRVLRIVNAPPNKRPAASKHYLVTPRISLDMVVASASIPILFNPVTVQGRTLWDGGLLVNSPMAPAVALGARRLVPVLVTTGTTGGEGIDNLGVAVERLVDTFLENAYNVDRKLLLDRNALAAQLPAGRFEPVALFRAIRPLQSRLFDAGSYLFFEREHMRAMYLAGRSAALTWLGRGPLLDRPTW